jgi:hypothetical protein
MFFTHHMTVHQDTVVTRIEWEYLPTPADWPAL